MKNLQIAKLFYEIADMLEMQGVEWKPRAYRTAAKSIESLSEDIERIYKKGKLLEIPGIGGGLAKKIVQFIETGKINEYERLKKQVPKHLNELMNIPSMGPKKAEYLHKNLGISTVKELEQAIRQHKISGLKGFGETSEENIQKGIELFKRGKDRVLLGLALPTANEIEKRLSSLKEVHKVSLAGSLRRMNETIGDIDILVTSSKPETVMDYFTTMPEVSRILAKGATKSTVILESGLQADIRVVDDASFGSALLYFTGSKDHNIQLRKLAIKKGLKLNEYGLFKNNKRIAGKTEKEVYKILGLPYLEPELRENRGEIEYGLKNKLPALVSYPDIKGDFHIHSKYSDGTSSIKEIALNAKKLGYEYVCVSDHSPGERIAHGLTEEQVIKKINEIKQLNKQFKGLKILCGAEVNIQPDGSLDYSDDLLKKLDIVLASVHSRFNQSKEETTKRIIKAMSNKYVDILAHPTGRKIGMRDPYNLDLNQVFKAAKQTKTVLEINCIPDRMDLNDINAKAAIDSGVKLAIDTDAHSLEQMRYMKLGVAIARRGWARKGDIVNTLSLEKLGKIFPKMTHT